MDRDGKSYSKWFVKLYALKFEKCFGIKNLQNKPRLTLKLVLLTFFSGLRSMKVLTFLLLLFFFHFYVQVDGDEEYVSFRSQIQAIACGLVFYPR